MFISDYMSLSYNWPRPRILLPKNERLIEIASLHIHLAYFAGRFIVVIYIRSLFVCLIVLCTVILSCLYKSIVVRYTYL